MKKLNFKTKKTGCLLVIFIASLLLSSCFTTQSSTQESPKENESNAFESAFDNIKPKEQNFSDKELEDITLWNSAEQRIFVQTHLNPFDENESLPYNPWIAAYEGFLMAKMLGFDEDFSTEEMYLFISAMFDGMPLEVEVGILVKSIVIPGWYDNGSPLVINLTRAFAGNQIPTAVYMFNSWDNLRSYGLSMIKKAGIAYEDPRLKLPEGDLRQEFMDSYMISWLDNGFITASNSIGDELPLFSSANDDFEKLNFTDIWLRDGNLDNDSEVLEVITEIIIKDDITPIGKVFARLQLFMYHLFHGEVESAQSVINELNESGLLELPEVGILAKRDLQRILDMAVRLSTEQ